MDERVLVVEDDEAIGEDLVDALRAHGYAVELAPDGASAVAAARRPPDLVLLDLGLPDLDGVAVARQVRALAPETVIVVLTARTDEVDVITALDAGADDYLTKPFRLAELLARVRAHLRRRSTVEGETRIAVGEVVLDLRSRAATVAGRRLVLRPKEFELLAVLMSAAGHAVRREQLMAKVWDENWFGSTKTLDVHVASLRQRLSRAEATLEISTVRGYGYRLDRC